MMRTIRCSAVLGLLLAAAACENEEVNTPFANQPVDPLFERYVSMGNSITAGFQSGGINDSTESVVRGVARAGDALAVLSPPARPGCPPPYTNVFTQTRVRKNPTIRPVRQARARVVTSNPPPYVNTACPAPR
jgi:hypothetical protein